MHFSAKAYGTAFPIYSTSRHPSAVRGPVPYFKCSRAEGVRSLTAVWQPSTKPLNGGEATSFIDWVLEKLLSIKY